MRILFAIKGFPSPGHHIHSYNLAKMLHHSHELGLVCFDLQTPYEKNRDFYVVTTLVPCDIAPLKDRFDLGKLTRAVMTGTPACVINHESELMAAAISTLCANYRWDVVLFEPLVMAQYGINVNGCARILFPVDATARVKEQEARASRGFLRMLARADYALTRRYEEWVYKRFDYILFAAESDRHFTLERVNVAQERVRTLAEGVDLVYFYPNESRTSAGRCLSFLGDMGHYPNEHAIIWFVEEVWRRLSRRVTDLKLLVIGNNPSEGIRRVARDDSRIVVTGYVQDFRPYIWDSSVFVCPLQIGTGMKNKMLQAMAMGKAIVASPSSIEGIHFEHGKHGYVARTSDEYVQYIEVLLSDPRTCHEMGHAARESVEAFHSLDKKAETFLHIADQAIRGARVHGHPGRILS